MTIAHLRVIFTLVLLAMLAVTTVASLQRGLFEAGSDLWPDWWFRATLADAYFGFLAVYLWIAWRERGVASRLVWLVLLATLGNIAIAGYVLWATRRMRGDDPARRLFAPAEAA